MRALSPAALGAALFLAACTGSPTQVMIVTDSDLAVPDELTEIRVAVTGPDGETQTSTATLGAGEPPLPRVLGLVHDGGALGPFVARVEAFRGPVPVVDRRATFSFEPGRVLVLRMDLLRGCVGVSCGADETCGEGGCRPRAVAPEELSEWQGPPPPRDAGPPPAVDAGPPMDGGPPPPADAGCGAELCNGVDDDCDDAVDEDFDLDTDPMNCGACGELCAPANASGRCVDGACALDRCDAGFGDCDGDPSNGCEADLTSPTSCGDCATACSPPNRDCCEGTCGRC